MPADLQRVLGDVAEVQGQGVVLAAHVHAVLVLVHVEDPAVCRPVLQAEVLEGAGLLQV